MRTIVFYTEASEVGGHEQMALTAHRAICGQFDDIRITWIVRDTNTLLIKELDRAGLTYAIFSQHKSGTLWGTAWSLVRRIYANARLLQRVRPDLVVLIQGNIILSSSGSLTAALSGTPYCSYIPMMFDVSSLSNAMLRTIARCATFVLHRTIHRYITIDRQIARSLKDASPHASVEVVENYVPCSGRSGKDTRLRESLRIPAGRRVLTIVGRIVFSHKCQDWIVEALASDPFLEDKYVLFVGDGLDADKLRNMLRPQLLNRFGMIGWRADLTEIYAATDVLLIPSRNEGVPLVMLEALSRRIPVVGSNVGGMCQWLPSDWRFLRGDVGALKSSIENALADSHPQIWTQMEHRLQHIQDLDRFALEFRNALVRYCDQ